MIKLKIMFKKYIPSWFILSESYFNVIFRFDEKEAVSGVLQLKSSVQKGIRTKLLEQYSYLEGYIDQILPKKDNLRIVKWLIILYLF